MIQVVEDGEFVIFDDDATEFVRLFKGSCFGELALLREDIRTVSIFIFIFPLLAAILLSRLNIGPRSFQASLSLSHLLIRSPLSLVLYVCRPL
jgi:hypothetical protein